MAALKTFRLESLRLGPRVPFAVPYWGAREVLLLLWLGATGRLIRGSHIASLQREVAAMLGKRHCIATNLGRSALELALRGVGCGADDEVIVPSYCCRSVLSAVLRIGCRPVFADIRDDLNVDPASVAARISPRTRAVVVPHLFGLPAQIEVVEAIAREKGIAVIDDAAQSLGASTRGRMLGSFGDVGIVSFGPGKTATSTGGGLLVTDRDDVIERVRAVPLPPEPYWEKLRSAVHFTLFRRYRKFTLASFSLARRLGLWTPARSDPDDYWLRALANVDAAIARVQLSKLKRSIQLRRRYAKLVRKALAHCPALRLAGSSDSVFTKCVAVIGENDSSRRADAYRKWMWTQGVEVQSSYAPIHHMPGSGCAADGSLPRTEALANRVVYLPADPSMSEADVFYAARRCARFFGDSVAQASPPPSR